MFINEDKLTSEQHARRGGRLLVAFGIVLGAGLIIGGILF